jgi:hypothetical protein
MFDTICGSSANDYNLKRVDPCNKHLRMNNLVGM